MKVQDLTLTNELRDIVQIGSQSPTILSVPRKACLKCSASSLMQAVIRCTRSRFIAMARSSTAEVVSAFYNFFNIQLEFLQPTGEDDTIWSGYLKMGQNGLHHIRFDVTDNDVVTKLMSGKGNRCFDGRHLAHRSNRAFHLLRFAR